MPIVDSTDRRRVPDIFSAQVCRLCVKYDFLDKEYVSDTGTIMFDWDDIFCYWTEPFPVKAPKPYSNVHINTLRSFCAAGWCEDWPDDWWELLADAFMFPEYID